MQDILSFRVIRSLFAQNRRSGSIFGCGCRSETACLAGRVLFGDLLPHKMGLKTVIWAGYPAQLMVPDGPRSLVVTTSGFDSHSSMFWVFFGLLRDQNWCSVRTLIPTDECHLL